MKILKKILKWMLIMLLALILWGVIFVNLHPVIGGTPKGMEESENYSDGRFQNINITHGLGGGIKGMMEIISAYRNASSERVPKGKLPSDIFEADSFASGDFVWFGHSTILMKIDDKTIITDPIFYRASPIVFFGKPFPYTNPPSIEALPKIDAVLISHDHYDHLDYKTITEMDDKVGNYYVPLGIKSHLERWGINPNKVHEFDWHDSQELGEVKLTFMPGQHFSGRGVTNRFSTLWGGWSIAGESKKVYFSGDTGYFDGFKEIGEKYGPFDIAFLENGAYSELWADVHMQPKESVQAGIDVGAKNTMPIHWGKFDLAMHSWYEPIQSFITESEKQNQSYFHPKIGKIFTLETLPRENWWEELIQE